jgi:tryptophan halogenase
MKIVIVGGGTAGWMTASTLVKAYPDWDISLYEDSKTPSVGVGESTTQYFRIWTHYLGLKDEEWMEACNATYKCSVRFHDFHQKGDDSWQYPFGPPRNDIFNADYWFYYAKKGSWSNGKFARDYSYAAACVDNNKFPEDNKYWQTGKFSGFHFDAVLFANWLRDNYAKPRGVKHIKKNLKKKPKADLVFDCTGFKSQFNDSPWIDVDYLPNNSAVVTRIGYQDKENQLKATTDCTALKNGWVWNVPTYDRIGTGYVYCDKFCTDKEAIDEFRNHLADNVEPDVAVYSDNMFRTIKWKTGRRKESWKDNVISIGLSAGFIEPLESNGILAIHNNLLTFLRVMDDRENITQYMRDTYNNSCNQAFDEFASFIGIHFSLTQRNDTPYWQHISDMCYPKDRLLDRVQRNYTESSYKFGQLYDWADNSTEGVFYVMAGHGWNPFNDAVFSEMDFFGASVDQIEEVPFNLDNLKSPWEYYKETIYEN